VFNSRIVVSAVKELFEFMIGLDLSVQCESAPFPRDHQNAVSGVVGFSGKTRGMVAIHCPEKVAMDITSALLGTEETEVSDDVRDAVGEVTNMIAGGLKAAADTEGVNDIELSIPTTICGERYSVGGFPSAVKIATQFSLPSGSFLVEVRYVG